MLKILSIAPAGQKTTFASEDAKKFTERFMCVMTLSKQSKSAIYGASVTTSTYKLTVFLDRLEGVGIMRDARGDVDVNAMLAKAQELYCNTDDKTLFGFDVPIHEIFEEYDTVTFAVDDEKRQSRHIVGYSESENEKEAREAAIIAERARLTRAQTLKLLRLTKELKDE